MTRWAGWWMAAALAAGCGPRVEESGADRDALKQVVASIRADAVRIETRTAALAAATARTYAEADRIVPGVDTNRYRMTPDGCYYKAVDDGGPALWVSGVVPIDDVVRRTVWATEGIDGDLRAVVRDAPEVAQVYFNDRHSMNRIFPPFDVLSQYEAKMNIPEFNFYYLADAKHNPERRTVWVDEPYVDPAGRGWMVSCIAPVYVGDTLEGVVGLDVTVGDIVERYLQPPSRAWVLIDRRGVVVAATEAAIRAFDMPPLTDHRYVNTVKSDRYRSDDYNVLRSPNAGVRRLAEDVMNGRKTRSILQTQAGARLVLAEPVPALGWTAMLVAGED